MQLAEPPPHAGECLFFVRSLRPPVSLNPAWGSFKLAKQLGLKVGIAAGPVPHLGSLEDTDTTGDCSKSRRLNLSSRKNYRESCINWFMEALFAHQQLLLSLYNFLLQWKLRRISPSPVALSKSDVVPPMLNLAFYYPCPFLKRKKYLNLVTSGISLPKDTAWGIDANLLINFSWGKERKSWKASLGKQQMWTPGHFSVKWLFSFFIFKLAFFFKLLRNSEKNWVIR